ncbi:MAG: Hsp70 family protein [Deltaproteobacteria bacterium]|nr:Hsp70 family protein [Deltaproteobacteria bacterium]
MIDETKPDPTFVVGIDLGTTNSVVAYTEARVNDEAEPHIRIFKIPQLVAASALGESSALPSFLLLPGPHDVPEGGLSLPWDPQSRMAVGTFARDRGAEIPMRMISSAKSWLCHTGVDRNKPILPWEGPDDREKLSPVEASAAILAHIRKSWNHAFARNDNRLCLEHQEIFLTVPASFDAVARNLTVKAAEMAGLAKTTLLEEPQAAFYAWIDRTHGEWRNMVKVDDLIMVADVGGGTTDLSLIKVTEAEGELSLERVSVGKHLLVGGDNMDLTLAYTVAGNMAAEGRKLNAHQLRGLCHGCRSAKEQLLSNEEAESYPITILGRGSRLIGGAIKTELTRDQVESVLKEGFFPICDRNARPQGERRAGMREMGLSYASDPAITHHLAQFLNQQDSPTSSSDTFVCPSAILFNGGVMKAKGLRKKVLDILSSWAAEADGSSPREIESNDFDLAVARGAAYYGLARKGQGIRIRSGLSKTYYIGVEASMPAVPGVPTPVKALCVAPFGMEEGSEATLPNKEFGLIVGEPVKFDFLGSNTRRHDAIGTVAEDWEGEIEPITTLETRLEGETGAIVPVTLETRVTEVGTLDLWCVSREDHKKFKLEFNVREKETD